MATISLQDIIRSKRGRWRALIEYINKQLDGGGGGEPPDGSITTTKLADKAVTYSKLNIHETSITLVGSETTASAILEYGPDSGYMPQVISIAPTEYSEGASVGYLKKYELGLTEVAGETRYTISIEASQAPGTDKTMVYLLLIMKVEIPNQ